MRVPIRCCDQRCLSITIFGTFYKSEGRSIEGNIT